MSLLSFFNLGAYALYELLDNTNLNTNPVTLAATSNQNAFGMQVVRVDPREYGWNETLGDADAYLNQLKESLEGLNAFLPEEILCYFEKQPLQIFAKVDWLTTLKIIKDRGVETFIEDLNRLFSLNETAHGTDYMGIEHFIIVLQAFPDSAKTLEKETKKFLGSLLHTAAVMDHRNKGCQLTTMLIQKGANLEEPSILCNETSLEYIIKNESLALLKLYFQSGYEASTMADTAIKLNRPNVVRTIQNWLSEKIKLESKDLNTEPYQTAQRCEGTPVSNSFSESEERIFQVLEELNRDYLPPKGWYVFSNRMIDKERTIAKIKSLKLSDFCEQIELCYPYSITFFPEEYLDKLIKVFVFVYDFDSDTKHRFQTNDSKEYWGGVLKYCIEHNHTAMALGLIQMGVDYESLSLMAAKMNDRSLIKALFDRGEDHSSLMNAVQEAKNKELSKFLTELIIQKEESNESYFKRTGDLIRL